jgi:hypothetical protein
MGKLFDTARGLMTVLVVAALGAPALARAAPPSDGKDAFGVAMGEKVSRLPGAKMFKPGWYQLPAAPKPDPRFSRLAVEAFPETGVCVVQAVGPEITGDPDGAKVRLAIDRLADDFSMVYGAPQKLDSCSDAACAPDLWGQDLQTGDRRYGYRWALHDSPKTGVREVSLIAVAHSVSSSVYLAQFDSGDLTACRANEIALP